MFLYYQQEKPEGKFTGENPPSPQPDSSDQIIEVKSLNAMEPLDQASKPGSNGMIIRGVTFYKSESDPMEPDHMVADDGEPGENCAF